MYVSSTLDTYGLQAAAQRLGLKVCAFGPADGGHQHAKRARPLGRPVGVWCLLAVCASKRLQRALQIGDHAGCPAVRLDHLPLGEDGLFGNW